MNPSSRSRTKVAQNRTVRKPASPVHAPYPFSAIVGQEEMKLALILNVIDPLIGGVLVMGHRGTGKSTAVRALADLLPQISVVAGCAFNCNPKDEAAWCDQCQERIGSNQKLLTQVKPIPVVDLPLGATEDRVCGTIAIERALREGLKTFEPGLLAHANRGFLYIDEVNLLEDHLVDLLLDVAATGRNKVEREGISIEHPSQFVLIGSGNPEEGELRPQLLDRFGLHAEVKTSPDLEQRIMVVERREAYDRNPEEFRKSFASEQEKLRSQITQGRKTLTRIKLERSLLRWIVELCTELKVEGHRGELTLMRAARALAAFMGRKRVTDEDVRAVAAMSLRHRLRRNAFEETGSNETISDVFDRKTSHQKESSPDTSETPASSQGQQSDGARLKAATSPKHSGAGSSARMPSAPAEGFRGLGIEVDPGQKRAGEDGNSGRNPGAKKRDNPNHERGRHTRSAISPNNAPRIAVAATLRALAGLIAPESRGGQGFTPVEKSALRFKRFAKKQGTLFIFAIDASGSMATRRIALAKRVMLDRLRQSYVNRDEVAIVSFRGNSAELVLPPSRSILRARRVVDSLTMGGATPLAAGLKAIVALLNSPRVDRERAVVLLFTDGHANVPLLSTEGLSREHMIDSEIRRLAVAIQRSRARVVVVDTQQRFEASDETMYLAEILKGQFVKLDS